MLLISGDVLDVVSETVQGPNGSFISTTIHLLAGLNVERIRPSRDFPVSDVPKKGEKGVTLEVGVSVFNTRSGPAYNLTALSRVREGARVAVA